MTSNIKEIKRVDPTREQVDFGVFVSVWETHPRQRNYKRRAIDPKFANRLNNYHPDHYEVKGIICGCDITDPVTGRVYTKGTKIKTDGHTTAEFYGNVRQDLQPKKLWVTHFPVYNWDELELAYDVFDNSDAAEKSNDRLDSAARAILAPKNLYLTAPELRKVTIIEYGASLLQPVLHERARSCNVREDTLRLQVVQDGLLWLQDIIQEEFDDTKDELTWGQDVPLNVSLACSYIAAYENYKLRKDDKAITKLRDFVIRVSNADVERKDPRTGKLDGVTFFIREWTKQKEDQRLFDKGLSGRRESLRGHAFTIRCIDWYVNDDKRVNNPNAGDLDNFILKFQAEYNGFNNIIEEMIETTQKVSH